MERLCKSENEMEIECPSVEIAAYLDGELSPDLELKLQAHLAKCVVCTQDLNDQKHFINALNSSLADGPAVPADFTKRIITNAESGVSGLRQKKERLNAVFVCCALFFFVLFTLGTSAPGTIAASFDIFGRVAAVFGFAGHMVYDVSIGVVVIMRSLAGQPAFGLIAFAVVVPMIVGTAFKFSLIRSGPTKSAYLQSGRRI
jgi:anti-sigma factor RsiW